MIADRRFKVVPSTKPQIVQHFPVKVTGLPLDYLLSTNFDLHRLVGILHLRSFDFMTKQFQTCVTAQHPTTHPPLPLRAPRL